MTMLYASYGLVLGFVQGGIGPVLIAHGVPVAQVGLTAILFLPLGLAFLWSPFIERWRLPALPDSTGWIVLMQLIAVALLVIIALGETFPLPVLLGLGLGVTIAMATMDIQLEGIIVETVEERLRPAAAAIKMGTFVSGALIGGGLLVGLFERIGWTATFVAMSAFLFTGVITLSLPGRAFLKKAKAPPVNLRATFARPRFLVRLFTAACLLASCFLLFGLNRVALVDLGVPLERVGWIVGLAAPLVTLPVIALTGGAAIRFGDANVFLVFMALGAVCGVTWMLATANDLPNIAIGATIAGSCALAGIYVILLGRILAWSEGERPATDYATLYGLGSLASMLPMAGAGALAATVGWSGYYAIATVLFVAATGWMVKTVRSK